jgi:ParB family chromosome partitioning protein
LLADLSAHRTAALRELLATKPDKALTALLVVLVRVVFFDAYPERCLKIIPSLTDLGRYAKTVGESRAAVSSFERHAQWQGRLPSADTLWPWLEALGEADRLALLAHCIAATLDCVERRGNESAADDSNRLAEALGLDMVDWWRPTEANFLGQVTKVEIVRAVSEGVSPLEGRRVADLKKGEMAARAETLLASSRWLPRPLCSPSFDGSAISQQEAAE